jgi:hypothetical protein
MNLPQCCASLLQPGLNTLYVGIVNVIPTTNCISCIDVIIGLYLFKDFTPNAVIVK